MEDRKNISNSSPHKIVFDERKKGWITGVTEVIAFDEKEISLKTNAGKIAIQGTGLTLARLDLELGEIDVQGTIDGIVYSKIHGENRNKGRKNLRRWIS